MHTAEQGVSPSTPCTGLLRPVLVLAAALFPPRVVLFLAVFAWHVQTVVCPPCIFFAQNDLFLWNHRFFRDFLMQPSGVAAWTGELVLQACHFGWPGALLLTAVAWLIVIATRGFVRCLSPSGSDMAWMAPAVVLLMAHSRYDYALSVSIGLALAMGAAFGYVRASLRWGGWRVAWFAGLCALLYYLAGAAFYVFALCVLTYEFYSPASRWLKLGLIVGAAVARLAVEGALAWFHPGLFYLHLPSTLPFAAERSLNVIAVALAASFPLCALLLADRTARQRRDRPGEASAGIADGGALGSVGHAARLRWVTGTVLFLGAAVLAGQLAAPRGVRTVLALHDCADSERWDEVLALAHRVPAKLYSQYVVHDVNTALYLTGRLPYDMFSYRQSGSPFVVMSRMDPHNLFLRRLGEFHLRLGRVNDAEYYVHESAVLHPSAQCLRLLARIAMVKGQAELARTFLNVLRDDLVYGSWADDWLSRLDQDPALSGEAEVAAIRSLRLAQEDIHQTAKFIPASVIAGVSVSTKEQIASLARQKPEHHMAFEFLMAVHLVNKDVRAVAGLLPKAAAFPYPATPPLYEEAAMIYARANKDQLGLSDGRVVVNGCPISEQTLDKIRRLDATLGVGGSDQGEIARVAEGLGLTYFCYYYRREEAP